MAGELWFSSPLGIFPNLPPQHYATATSFIAASEQAIQHPLVVVWFLSPPLPFLVVSECFFYVFRLPW